MPLQRICAAKGCETSIPAYCRYCMKHEDEFCVPDVIVITSQPTKDSHTETHTDSGCCGCCCCEGGCCEGGCCEDGCCEDGDGDGCCDD